ncbi:MAG: M20/M25/M40 family metallo-hydrolase [Ignavibacteriaceae bacterium]|nr:M20/M25/M40 family metallo-hydrolase [Ignavibacteriaceae bacterium]
MPEFFPEQFKPCLQGDRLYGRGSSEMKGGLMAMPFALLALKECGLELKGRITFSFVPDEESGVGFNIVPDRAFFTIDRRINPEESLAEAKKELMSLLDNYKKKGIEIEVKILQEGESSVSDTKAALASALKETVRDATEKIPRFELSPGLIEIRFFNKREIPGFAYGPGLLEVSHGAEEYVRVSDILNCAKIYSLRAARLLT